MEWHCKVLLRFRLPTQTGWNWGIWPKFLLNYGNRGWGSRTICIYSWFPHKSRAKCWKWWPKYFVVGSWQSIKCRGSNFHWISTWVGKGWWCSRVERIWMETSENRRNGNVPCKRFKTTTWFWEMTFRRMRSWRRSKICWLVELRDSSIRRKPLRIWCRIHGKIIMPKMWRLVYLFVNGYAPFQVIKGSFLGVGKNYCNGSFPVLLKCRSLLFNAHHEWLEAILVWANLLGLPPHLWT